MSSGYLNYTDGQLCLGPSKIPLARWTENYFKPVYIYDRAIVRERVRKMQKALPGVKMYYAMKANSNLEILKCLREEGCGADLVSGGEALRAMEAGFSAEQMIYSGVGKTKREIREALVANIAQINVESLPELLRIAEIAKTLGKLAKVSLRLNPDVDIQTHKYIATGLKDNKFGMELSLLPELIQVFKKFPKELELQGISLHLGSMMKELSGFQEALKKLIPVYQELKKEFVSVRCFDFGGGLGIVYENQDLEGEEKLLQQYAEIALGTLKGLGAELQCEPGRWLVAHSGVLLTEVQYLKKTSHKNFVVVDTGMHHLLRPALYSAFHKIWALKDSSAKIKADIVGPICESADFLGHDRELASVKDGDFLVIADAGAYGFSMMNTYNLQEPPLEVVV